MNKKQLAGYLHAKKQHSKTSNDRAIYAELIDDMRQFPNQIAKINALIKLINA